MNQETKSVDQVLLSNHSAVYQTIYDRLFYKICRKILAQMLAAMNDVDDATLYKLRLMCSDEVKRINGIINFEKAVRYQRSE